MGAELAVVSAPVRAGVSSRRRVQLHVETSGVASAPLGPWRRGQGIATVFSRAMPTRQGREPTEAERAQKPLATRPPLANPRTSYPEGRVAYQQWRIQLGRFRADTVTRILECLGSERELIDAACRINPQTKPTQQFRHSDHGKCLVSDLPANSSSKESLCQIFPQESDRSDAEDLEKDERQGPRGRTRAAVQPGLARALKPALKPVGA